MNNILSYGKIIVAMLLWGSIGIFVRYANQPAPIIAFFRVFTAFIILGTYIKFYKITISRSRQTYIAILSGCFMALNWLFLFKAFQLTTIGNAIITYNFAPILSIIWARILLKEKIQKTAISALSIALVGLFLMFSNYRFSFSSSDFSGILFGLSGGIFYSFIIVLVKSITCLTPTQIAYIQMGISSVILFPLAAFSTINITWPSLWPMLLLGCTHTAFALNIYFSGLRQISVQHTSILSYLEPTSAIIYAYFIFAETPSLLTAIGGSLILCASLLVVFSSNPQAVKQTAEYINSNKEEYLCSINTVTNTGKEKSNSQ